MSVASFRVRSIVAIAIATVLAGCTAAPHVGLGQRPLGERESGLRRIDVVYVANYFNDNVQIYALPGLGNIGMIQGITNPQGLAVDRTGNLYVVDQNANDVLVFHKGKKVPFRTLTDTNGIAFQIAVGRDGTVYLTNEFDNNLGNGNVNEYAPGSTQPSKTLHNSRFNTVEGVGLDSNNNLYVTFDDNHVVGRIEEYAPGSSVGKLLLPKLKAAGGITFDSADDLVVCDQTAPAVKIFAQGSGNPKGEFAQRQIDPFNLALTKSQQQIFVTDPHSGNTYEYAYPSGTLLQTIPNNSGSNGVAVGQI
jgi:sugar lactone lactonase YvrE